MKEHDAPQLVPLLEHVTHTVGIWVERTFRDVGLTQAEAHVLAYLARHPDATINDLHTSFGHKRSTLTSLLDRLEARGWLRRSAHPTSRRLVAIQLTDAGRAIGERVSEAVDAIEERIRAGIGSEAITGYIAVIHALEEEMK